MIIAMLHEKGGCGKTTLSINLAKAFKEAGYSVLLVDADPQGSVRDWHAQNDGEILDVIGLDRLTIDKDIRNFKDDYEYIFIDGAPRLSAMVTKTLLCADVVLIPAAPSPFDVWASPALVELIKQRQEVTNGKLKAAFVVNRKIDRTVVGREIEEVLRQYELPVLKQHISQRIAYAQSAASGRTVLCEDRYETAAEEIRHLALELQEFIYGDFKTEVN